MPNIQHNTSVVSPSCDW